MRRPPQSSPTRATPLDLDRFSALARAYGGDLRRWPEADRAAAQRLARDVAIARARLAEAEALDALLDLSHVAAPSAGLRQRILAQAPMGRPATARSALRRWLSGLGAIGVLACGAMAGAAVVAVSGPIHVDADGLAGLYDQANNLDIAGT